MIRLPGNGSCFARMPIFATIKPSRRWGTRFVGWVILTASFGLMGCRSQVEAPGSVVMIIESSPNNLDLRQGTDAQSERVGGLIFDALVKKEH